MASALAIFAAARPAIADPVRFGAACNGSETVKVGDQPATNAPYALTFSADLQRRLYCSGRCTREETWSITDASSDPVKLSDLAFPGQTRRILYSPANGRLTDDQTIEIGPVRVERHARADCQPAAYRAPPPN